MDADNWAIIIMFCLLASLPLTAGGFRDLGDTESIGLITSTFYSSWPWPHTTVSIMQYNPQGILKENVYNKDYEGNLDLKLGSIYKIKAHKNFFQLFPTIIEIMEVSAS